MKDEPELVSVADGVYAWLQPDGTWWLNNAGVVLGDDGVVLVDTCATRRRTERFLAEVDTVSGKAPIRFAVNTHLHGDHTYGNALLPADTAVVAHEMTREGLLADFLLASTPPIWSPTPEWGISAIRAPSVVLRDELTLFTGTRRVELRHPGYAAHTEGDVVVWLPDERVLFTGDLLFHHITPLVMAGSIDGALRSLDWMAGFGADTVVPGHGTLIDAADLPDRLAGLERYYRLVADVARDARAAGLTQLAAAQACDLGEFATWPDAERLVPNLHRAYADATGTRVDQVAALTEATTWLGGPLHTDVN
ncbi:MAG TPA: MBL fold metallo-hydrolase [Pseudonocardiaceae bacterium]|nr:MBL fold metallo-hydrolase [Pseudonocardiaceae bacterium]